MNKSYYGIINKAGYEGGRGMRQSMHYCTMEEDLALYELAKCCAYHYRHNLAAM